jgi:hypothetical protein
MTDFPLTFQQLLDQAVYVEIVLGDGVRYCIPKDELDMARKDGALIRFAPDKRP